MRAWQINSGDGVAALELADVVAPEPGPGEVLIDVQASSINYRDLTTIEDPITRKLAFPTVPNSDGAGVVAAVGDGVTEFAPGDAVTSCFFADWVNACQAVKAAQGSVAASRALRWEGVWMTPSAGNTTCSASTPWRAPPNADAIAPGEISPLTQSAKKQLVTASPGANSVTPAPTAATTPAPSEFGTVGNTSLRVIGSSIVVRSR